MAITRRNARLAALPVALLAWAAAPAGAQTPGLGEEAPPARDWVVAPAVEAAFSYTDNVFGAPDGRAEDDLILRLSPMVTITGLRPNLRFRLDYALDYLDYQDTDGLDDFHSRLEHAGTLEAVEDLLFLDTAAAVSRETIDPRAALSAREMLAGTNATTVATYSLSPYLRGRLKDLAAWELRYGFGQVLAEADDVADAKRHRLAAELDSGPAFTRLTWSGSVSATETEFSDAADRSTSRRLAMAEAQYALTRRIAILGGAGLETIEDPTLAEDIEGAVWRIGVALRPGPRSRLQAAYNHRFESEFWTGEAEWQIGRRTHLSASHARSVETAQGLIARELDFFAVDAAGNIVDLRRASPLVRDEFGNFASIRTLERLNLAEDAFSLRDAAFHRRISEVEAAHLGARDSFRVLGFHEEREFDITGLQESVFGASFNWEHRLTPTTDAGLTLRWRRIDFGTFDDRIDDVYGASLGLTHSLRDDLTVFAGYDLLYRDSGAARGDSTENVITVGLRKRF